MQKTCENCYQTKVIIATCFQCEIDLCHDCKESEHTESDVTCGVCQDNLCTRWLESHELEQKESMICIKCNESIICKNCWDYNQRTICLNCSPITKPLALQNKK
jgi:hypothetical protein